MFKNLKQKVLALAAVVGLPLVAGQALAAVPSEVTTAISSTQTDAVTVAGLMIGIIAALLVFKFIRAQMH